MRRFDFVQLVHIVQREIRAREELDRGRPTPTLFDQLVELRGLPRDVAGLGRWDWDPMPRIKAMGKPILRGLGLYEPVRAWWKSR